jgi:hypothetical protein
MDIPKIDSLDFESYDPYSILNHPSYIKKIIGESIVTDDNSSSKNDKNISSILAEEILNIVGGQLFYLGNLFSDVKTNKNHNLMQQLIREQIKILENSPDRLCMEIGRCYICASLICFQNLYDKYKYGGFYNDIVNIVNGIRMGSLWKACVKSTEEKRIKSANYVTNSALVLIFHYLVNHNVMNQNLSLILYELTEWKNDPSIENFYKYNQPTILKRYGDASLKNLLCHHYTKTTNMLREQDSLCNNIIDSVRPSRKSIYEYCD